MEKGGHEDSSREKIDSAKLRTIHFRDGIPDDLPARTILPKRVASMGINFNRGGKIKSGSLQANSLTSGPSTNLKDC
jgi:hypothetical protein